MSPNVLILYYRLGYENGTDIEEGAGAEGEVVGDVWNEEGRNAVGG